MFTLHITEGEDGTFKEPQDAIKYMYETNFTEDVSIYDINEDKARNKAHELYVEIAKYNKGKPINEQILPSQPLGFRGILGCLGVKVYTMSLGTYEENHDKIALMSGWNSSVLDREGTDAHITPSLKALSSLAMLGGLYRQKVNKEKNKR